MKRVLFRSVSFWSGILVMAFICWAWRDSTRSGSSLNRGGWWMLHCGSGVSISHLNGGRGATRWDILTGLSVKDLGPGLDRVRLGRPFFLRNRAKDVPHQGPFDVIGFKNDPMAKASPVWYFGGGTWDFFLPYWILLLAFALLWSALLFWRARRKSIPPRLLGKRGRWCGSSA